MPPQLMLPESLIWLADLVSETLGGPPARTTLINDRLIALAGRHQISALLYATAINGRHGIAVDGLRRLEESYRDSAARRIRALARLHAIAACFAEAGIGWMALKGTTQAEQLYSDPAWRMSSDIDLLVAPRDFRRALRALAGLGFTASNPPLPRWLGLAVTAAVRDVTLIANNDHTCAVELHRRLFFAPGGKAPRFSCVSGALPAPGVDAALAFYLISHGARSFWVRLKWLADLVPLFAKLAPSEPRVLLELAREAGAEQSFAASLLLLEALFPFAAPPALASWLEAQARKPGVRKRMQRYCAMLNLADDQKHSPLSSALIMLEADWLLFDTPSARLRLLGAAPVSSAMRRLAAWLAPADRALTLPR